MTDFLLTLGVGLFFAVCAGVIGVWLVEPAIGWGLHWLCRGWYALVVKRRRE